MWQAVRDLAAAGTTVLLTTQYLDEAEQLADRIAILHDGRIIENGTLAQLKALLPPAKVEYVEKQPTLEDVFFALVGHDATRQGIMTTHFVGDTALLTGRCCAHHPQPRHDHHHDDHADRLPAAVRLRVRRGHRHRGRRLRRLPAARHPDHHGGIGLSYTAYRLFLDLQSGIFERFHSMPIARSAVLWAHVLTSLAAIAMSVVVVVLVAVLFGFRSGAGILAWLAVAGILALFTLALTWLAVILGLTASSVDEGERVLPSSCCRSSAPPSCPLPPCPARCEPSPRTSRSPRSSTRSATCWPASRSAATSGSRSPGARLPGARVRVRHARLPPPDRLKQRGVGQAGHMPTIGRLASYAGVTIRAVRHYHKVGLLPEPERDASGYRTYDAAAVVRLIRIRTLPTLARVRERPTQTPPPSRPRPPRSIAI